MKRLPTLGSAPAGPDFDAFVADRGAGPLFAGRVTTLQVNVGKLCNMACHHCHVDAGPRRAEILDEAVAERLVELLARSPGVAVVDVTGGAPELCPSFRFLVTEARRLGRRVLDRCNLTVLFEPGMDQLAEFLADHEVGIVASLPCYAAANVDAQRGKGTFDKSVEALRRLNALGYGRPGSRLALDLVFNPLGPTLPPPQAVLEAKYHEELDRLFGVSFDRLLTITNMPIARFAHALERDGRRAEYMSLLVNHFNPGTLGGLMCRSLVSVDYRGVLYDCDFNQMLELPLSLGDARARARGVAREPVTIWDVADLGALEGRRIATGPHCFGCTAGSGSSCGGALA